MVARSSPRRYADGHVRALPSSLGRQRRLRHELMPAPAPGGPQLQVFGLEDSPPTRAALRFFKERRVTVHFVDLRRKPMAPGELRRFVDRLGAAALADSEGKRWAELGLGYLRMTDAELADRLLADQRLLRLPLVRLGNRLTAGRDEAGWKAMVKPET